MHTAFRNLSYRERADGRIARRVHAEVNQRGVMLVGRFDVHKPRAGVVQNELKEKFGGGEG
jgi:hypothetical protein